MSGNSSPRCRVATPTATRSVIRKVPTCRAGGPPAFPPRPPSAPLGGTFPLTASIHARAPTRDLFNNAGPSS